MFGKFFALFALLAVAFANPNPNPKPQGYISGSILAADPVVPLTYAAAPGLGYPYAATGYPYAGYPYYVK